MSERRVLRDELDPLPGDAASRAGPTTETLPAAGEAGAGAPASSAPPVVGAAGAAVSPARRRSLPPRRRLLAALVLAGLAGAALTTGSSLRAAGRGAERLRAGGEAATQSQRLAKSATQALAGNPAAFAEVRDSAQGLGAAMQALQLDAADAAAVQQALDPLRPLVERMQRNAVSLLAQQAVLAQVGQALQAVVRGSADVLEAAQAVLALKLQHGAPAAEAAAAGRLALLAQRIGTSAVEMRPAAGGVGPDTALQLGRDLNALRELARALLEGSAEQRLAAAREAQTRERLAALLDRHEDLRTQAGVVLSRLKAPAAAVEAQAAIAADSEPLRRGLEAVQERLAAAASFDALHLGLLLLCTAAAGLGTAGLLRLSSVERARRWAAAEAQRRAAGRLEREARRVNDANQAAILRLMNELQAVAEGDLTQQATVTEDITGAIADSVNYTVEELRSLVAQVQETVGRVTETTDKVDNTSSELLATAAEQLREIRATGEAVLHMAGRINGVSAQAERTAAVARQSLDAAESGLRAVQAAIGGMHSIRDQIQETSKRLKRLGESSQEIGEITELISDITEQTNVLALNAAIQAASAGEAGRGFSVVAEEVQRLAERSADATRQIAALVKAIQTDMHDAAGAMERSTQGVVEGTKLSDAAGTALAEIDRVSRRLADLITDISAQASSEAQSANVVAANIQHIFAVTEQTGEGTRSTAQTVRELSRTAEELRQSVARFKIA